jgi:hypothetical protein
MRALSKLQSYVRIGSRPLSRFIRLSETQTPPQCLSASQPAVVGSRNAWDCAHPLTKSLAVSIYVYWVTFDPMTVLPGSQT